MAPRFMLDTNIVSHFVRYPTGAVANRLRTVGRGEVLISVIVLSELYFGAIKVQSNKLRDSIDATVAVFEIVPLQVVSADDYAEVRSVLEAQGTPIGGNDLLIAAHALALALDLTLVTDNVRVLARAQSPHRELARLT